MHERPTERSGAATDSGGMERAADASAMTSQRLETLDGLATGVLILSRDLHLIYANARWEEWMGIAPVAGAPLAGLIHGSPDEVERLLRAVHSDGESRTIDLSLYTSRADSSARRVRSLVRRCPEGLVLEARPDAEQDGAGLHDIARRLAEVSDTGEVLHLLCEIASRQCQGTGAAVLRLRMGEGEVVAASGSAIPARGRSFELRGSLLEEVMQGGVAVSEEDFRRSGRPLMRAVPELSLGPMIVAPLRAHGEMLGVVAVARGVGGNTFGDVEFSRLSLLADHAALAVQKTLLLEQAQSADRAKGRFLATMSHELRTPLTALAGYNELLADEVIGPLSDPQLDILERMRSVTTHLSAMIEEILAFTNLEEGREVVRASEFLAEDLVRSALAVVEPLAQHKQLELQVDLPAASIRMTSDIDKARQILVNLLGNAVKFTDGGTIGVRLGRNERGVRVDIQDTGVGIPAEELARLFRPFAQVDSGLTRRHGGTGLGLYISRRLASLLGGYITVDSAPGIGSTFSVVLPDVCEQ